jgi:hypothetical protein
MKKNASLFIFLFFFVISCKYFGDPITKVKGNVTDSNGQSISGVLVTMEEIDSGRMRLPDKQTTGQDGKFNFSRIGGFSGKVWLSYEKAGFKSIKTYSEILVEKENNLEVVLEKEQ